MASGSVLARVAQALVDFALAVAALVAFGAEAAVAVAKVFAHSAVLAEVSHFGAFLQGSIFARHHGHITEQACPPWLAGASIRVVGLLTAGSIEAWVGGTPVHKGFTAWSHVPEGTVAGVVANVVDTGGPVGTGLGVALVDVVLAVGAGVARTALARVVVHSVHTCAAIHARTRGAVFIVGLAIGSTKAREAGTGITVYIVIAGSSILAGVAGTLVHVVGTVFSAKSIHAQTGVLSNAIQTCSSILAGVRSTVVSVGEAVPTLVAAGAEALIRSVDIDARGLVAARR